MYHLKTKGLHTYVSTPLMNRRYLIAGKKNPLLNLIKNDSIHYT